MDRYEQNDERQTPLWICNTIEKNFEGAVRCNCINRWLFGEIGFTCESQEAECSDLPGTGTYCAKTLFAGSFNLRYFQLATVISMRACQTNVWANNTVAGDVEVGDICFEIDLTGRLLGETGISKCQADFKDIKCVTCSECKYDVPKTNRTGVGLNCNNLKVQPCFPFEVPAIIKARGETTGPMDTLLSMRPKEVTLGPAMDYAMLRVEEEIFKMGL